MCPILPAPDMLASPPAAGIAPAAGACLLSGRGWCTRCRSRWKTIRNGRHGSSVKREDEVVINLSLRNDVFHTETLPPLREPYRDVTAHILAIRAQGVKVLERVVKSRDNIVQ